MFAKTIRLDREAFDLLSRRKKKGQSYSEVIKEHFGLRSTSRDLRRAIQEADISEETLDLIEEQVEARRLDPVKPVRL